MLTEERRWSTFYLLRFYNLIVLFQTRLNILWNIFHLHSLLFLLVFLAGNTFWRWNTRFRQLLFYFLAELFFSQARSRDDGIFLLHFATCRPCGFPDCKAAMGKWVTPTAALRTWLSRIQTPWPVVQVWVTLSVMAWGSITRCHNVWVIQAWIYHHLPGC